MDGKQMIRRILSVVVSTTLFFALSLGAALAKQAGDHDGDADRRTDTRYTEDNDTNDGGTRDGVVDSGDNKHPSGQDRSVENGGSGTQGKSESDPDNDGKGPDRSNGGIDKANGPGGDDLADQDGNNGCGNDDDFEDDNEGLCLGRQRGPNQVGSSASQMSIEVDCFSVSVSSSKDISFVEVTFADDTTIKLEGLHDSEFSETFDKEVVMVRAKSGTTVVSETADENVCIEGSGEELDGSSPSTEVLGASFTSPLTQVLGAAVSSVPTQVLGANFEAGQTLPVTGASFGTWLLVAGAMLAVGILADTMSRRRRAISR